MMHQFLIGSAYSLIAAGIFFVLWSFRRSNRKNSKRKLIRVGGIGVIIALFGGLILIFFQYAIQPVPERIIDEHLEENYPDKTLDVSLQVNLQQNGNA